MTKHKPRVLIEVSGGVVQAVVSDADIDLIFVNWDDADEGVAPDALASSPAWERLDRDQLDQRLRNITAELDPHPASP